MTQDIKTKRIVASLLHSRAMVTGAPRYVLVAMQQWVEELDRAEETPTEVKSVSAFTEGLNVTDDATLKLVTPKDKLVTPKEDKRN